MDAGILNDPPPSEERENAEDVSATGEGEVKAAEVDDKMSPENSEYDSAGSYSDEEEQDVKVRSKASDLDERSNSDDGGSLILKREEGDGQESLPTKKVDDDEDKKNPQYIPKRGTFYEHDDRTAEDESNERPEAEKEKEAKKKVWQDKKEKWSHDKFDDTEQAPKTRAELIAIYGYDIRNEEGPPRARRRRRYGRGPNKYTRTWEDEAAYTKAPPINKPKKPTRPTKNTEEFPPLVASPENPTDEVSNQIQREQEVKNSKEKTEVPRESTVSQSPPESRYEEAPIRSQEAQSNRTPPQRTGSGRIIKPKKEIKDSDYRGFTAKTRLQRTRQPENQNQSRNEPVNEVIHTLNFTNKNLKNNVVDLEQEMNKLSVEGGSRTNNKFSNNQRQVSMPPRLQSEQKGSKRYSSMRQRSLPEANTPPAVPNYQHTATFYSAEYNQQSVPKPASQNLLHQANTHHHHSTAQVPQIAPQSIPIAQQVPVTAAAIPLQFPVPPAAFPQAPPTAFLQPGVAPPGAFIAPQTPGLINYVQGQPGFPPPNYQEFPQQFSPVTQPAELYQPQGGITYYSTDQQIAQRPAPQKRPKAAIPIIAPPGEDRKDNAFGVHSELSEESVNDINEATFESQQ